MSERARREFVLVVVLGPRGGVFSGEWESERVETADGRELVVEMTSGRVCFGLV